MISLEVRCKHGNLLPETNLIKEHGDGEFYMVWVEVSCKRCKEENQNGLRTALKHAEQTLRNLGNGDLKGNSKTIALESATNAQKALKETA